MSLINQQAEKITPLMSRKFSNENNPARKLTKFSTKRQQRALSATHRRPASPVAPAQQSYGALLSSTQPPNHTFKIFNRNKSISNKNNLILSQATKMMSGLKQRPETCHSMFIKANHGRKVQRNSVAYNSEN